VNGSFTCNVGNITMSPDPNGLKNTTTSYGSTNYTCVYLVGSGGTISLNASSITVDGDLYAPDGYITCNSNTVDEGWWEAQGISISCTNFQLDGIPGRSGGISTPELPSGALALLSAIPVGIAWLRRRRTA
jgi:hypothetical protein